LIIESEEENKLSSYIFIVHVIIYHNVFVIGGIFYTIYIHIYLQYMHHIYTHTYILSHLKGTSYFKYSINRGKK
jgi:hypothetical protein